MIVQGDCLEVLKDLPDGMVRCCVTSPPYWGLRDYGVEGQMGNESTPDEYVRRMVAVFAEVRRVLADDGTLWLNLGDTYASGGGSGAQGKSSNLANREVMKIRRRVKTDELRALDHRTTGGIATGTLKPKDLVGIPWMVAFALRADGWYLRQEIIWHKPNPMPESVRDRCTRAHEQLFLLSKSPRYYFDAEAIKTPTRPKTFTVSTSPCKGDGTGSTGEKWNKRVAENGGRRHYPTANKRDVWTISSRPFKGAHFAVFPPPLIEPCVLAGSAPRDTVLDPFAGAGTVGLVCARLGREHIGIELNPEYVALAEARISGALKK